jgi:hypothetical protein
LGRVFASAPTSVGDVEGRGRERPGAGGGAHEGKGSREEQVYYLLRKKLLAPLGPFPDPESGSPM